MPQPRRLSSSLLGRSQSLTQNNRFSLPCSSDDDLILEEEEDNDNEDNMAAMLPPTGIEVSLPSITLAPHELKNIMCASERNEMTLREMMEDSAATGLVLKANQPWKEVHGQLHYDFLRSVQARRAEVQVFETVADFIGNCTDSLELMRGMKSKVESSDLSPEEINLENERNTWRLVYCLYQNRLDSADFTPDPDLTDTRYISEKEVIAALFKSSRLIREYQLIIDWLERNARDQADRLPSVENFTDRTVPWENTLHQLENEKSGVTFLSSRPIAKHLDPDAPIREGRPIHDMDQEDDARLEKRMLIEVRCGRLQRAQALAIHCGQMWRAACLNGWVPYHDPNYKAPASDTRLPVEGNPNRSLWKLCAWHISNDERVGQHYRAIFSSLCGNLRQLLSCSTSWQDGLWSYMKTLLDIKVEAEVRGFMPKHFIDMPEDYWKGENTLEDIFDELEASTNPKIASQSHDPAHRIQKHLILDDVPALMQDIERLLEQSSCDAQFLRFLAHLLLFLRQLGKRLDERVVDRVLLEYVKVLVDVGDPVLVAYYTSNLPADAQVGNYASFLERIVDSESRRKCLAAAEEANLNVEAITKLLVENIRQKEGGDRGNLPDLKGGLTEADLEKISALEWLCFYQTQREEALWQTNALIRYFLAHEKLDAARKAFNKLPADSIESIMNEFPGLHNTLENLMTVNVLPKRIHSSIREYLCFKAYLDAQEGFIEWFSHYHHDKPVPVEDLTTYASFPEKVAHEHKQTIYTTELERWKTMMQRHTKAVKQLLFNVLLFPDGGWLADSNGAAGNEPVPTSEEILREHQLDKLRKVCIPKIALLLYTVMTEMGEHDECIKLADTLASEQHQLYKVFSKEKLKEIFKKFSESSLALMNQKKDPWGYSK